MTKDTSRRLAAVWFADIVGYTNLAARDEDLALRVVRELQRITRTQCDARGGRVVKLLGDGVLTVFDSADGAIRAATGVRDGFLRSSEVQTAEVSLRIGLHLGDVTEGIDGDIYGDAVNAAHRIERIAEPGQVVISDVAYKLLQSRVTLDVEDLGEHDLKGLGSVRLYSASISGETGPADLRELLQSEIAPLQVLDVAGLGGMGEIYLARDPRLRRTLAVKVLRSELVADRQARARFFREAQVIAGLSHPNIISIHSVGELKDGTPFFVMDYIEGGSLADRVAQNGPLAVADARRIVGEIAAALAAAHAKGVVHRDIKASNILFDTSSGRALVTDWGIAAFDPTLELSPDMRLTRTGVVIGSPKFMSPEQLAGDEVGRESDIYSLGLVAFELLTGEGPFEAETPRAAMIAHLREDAPRLSSVRDGVDPEFDALIARCLEKNPSERVTAEEIAARFAPGADAVLEWPPPGLESLQGRVFPELVAWSTAVLMIFLPILLSFFARMPWVGQDAVRDLVHGQLGVSLMGMLGFGIAVVFLAGTFALQRQTVIMGDDDEVAVTSRDPVERALSLGYGWRTMLEVALDRWGDYGNVLAGQREYAVLDVRQRARVRRRVLMRGLFVISSILALTLGLPLAAWATPWLSAKWAFSLFVGLPMLGLIVGIYLVPTDPMSVKLARNSLADTTKRELLESEIEAWRDANAKVTHGQGIGPGRTIPRWFYRLVKYSQIALLPVFIAYPIAIFLVMAISVNQPRSNAFEVAARIVPVLRHEHLRPPLDSTIAPTEALELIGDISAANAAQTWMGARPEPELLGTSDLVDSGRNVPFGLDVRQVISASLGNLTSAEVEYLRRFGGDPRTPAFTRLARAAGYDPSSSDQYPPDMIWEQRPDRRLPGLMEAAVSVVALAGYELNRGREAEAEEALRAVFSVGYLLASESNDVTEAALGRNVAILGLDALRDLFAGTGRLSEASSINRSAGAVAAGGTWHEWVANATTLVSDTTQARSARLAMVHDLIIALECTSLEGMVLGLPRELRRTLGEATASLRRYPSDDAFLSLAVGSHERLQAQVAEASTAELKILLKMEKPFLFVALRWVGRLIRNPRLLGCIAVTAR